MAGYSLKEYDVILRSRTKKLATKARPTKVSRKPRVRRASGESEEQEGIFNWIDQNIKTWPDLKWLHAIPNGGYRRKFEALRLKRQGVKPGVPDLFLPVPKGTYHGMYIEMKYGNNKPTVHQQVWLTGLQGFGYFTCVCYNSRDAIQKLLWYLDGCQIEEAVAVTLSSDVIQQLLDKGREAVKKTQKDIQSMKPKGLL